MVGTFRRKCLRRFAGSIANACRSSVKFLVFRTEFDENQSEFLRISLNYTERVELQKGTESAKGTGEVDGALEGSSVVEWRCSF